MVFRSLLMVVLAMPALAAAEPALAIVTIVDGAATVIRDAAKLSLVEGVRLSKDDIIETGITGRLLRIEFADGVALDLGPESRALLAPRFSSERGRLPAKLYLLQGMAKLTVPKGDAQAAAVLSSPAFDVTAIVRSAVFLMLPGESYAFAESGDVHLQERVQERLASKAGATVGLKGGEFYTRHGDAARGTIGQRPTNAFIQRLPRQFLDTLPWRASLFNGREVEPKRLGNIAYPDVEAWVNAEGLRALFVARWKALAQDTEFRKGLVANIRSHPEWDRVLFPEKYLHRPASASAEAYGAKR